MREHLAAAMKEALRDKDQTRLSTLRLITAAIKDRDIAARSEHGAAQAGDDVVLQLLGKMIKQREDSVCAYEEAGRLDLADRERAEIAVIRDFLPEPLSEAETEAAVRDAITAVGAGGLRDMGRVMAVLKQRYAGRMDFSSAGARVKNVLAPG